MMTFRLCIRITVTHAITLSFDLPGKAALGTQDTTVRNRLRTKTHLPRRQTLTGVGLHSEALAMLDMMALAGAQHVVGFMASTFSWYLREVRCLLGSPISVSFRRPCRSARAPQRTHTDRVRQKEQCSIVICRTGCAVRSKLRAEGTGS